MTKRKDYRGMELLVNGKECFVAQCDREIGISIKTLDDNELRVCLNKEEFLQSMSKHHPPVIARKVYAQTYNKLLRFIREGEYRNIYIDYYEGKLLDRQVIDGSKFSCAWE